MFHCTNRIPGAARICSLAVLTAISWPTTGKVLGQCPAPPAALVENVVSAEGKSATVGIDGCGRFVVGWEQRAVAQTGNLVDVLVRQYKPEGTALTDAQRISADNPVPSNMAYHTRPSIAMSVGGLVRVGWLGQCDDCHPSVGPLVLILDFLFGAAPGQLLVPGQPVWPLAHYEPSVGISDAYGGAAATLEQEDRPDRLGEGRILSFCR